MSQPFFIVGIGRSGSTMLYRILDRHPKVALTNEGRVADFLAWVSAYAAVPRGQQYRFHYDRDYALTGIPAPWEIEHFDQFFRAAAPRLLEDWYRARFPDKDFTHWGDKLPLAHTPAAGQTSFPHARFVVLVRDPRDVVCSLFAFARRRGDQLISEIALDARVHARAWRSQYQGYLTYLEHRIVVRYEDLLADTGAEVDRILEFLGLDPGVDLRSDDDERYRKHHATTKDPQASVARWRQDLTAADLACVESLCGELMPEFGYRLSTDS